MKKAWNIAALAVLGLSAFYLGLFVIMAYSTSTSTGSAYWRFTKQEGSEKSFNWWALLSPLQVEAQQVRNDTLRFRHRVHYPVAPKFDFIAPENDTADRKVGREIAQVIRDSVRKIFFDRWFDYDGTSLAVREAAHPETRQTGVPIVSISLLGTASPEAVKYGLAESLKPGHIEKENLVLAQQRLDRTADIIISDLSKNGMSSVKIRNHAEELQLRQDQVAQAIANPSMLDSMRYVEATISIVVPRLHVTPATAPIALPLWMLALGAILIPLLARKRRVPVRSSRDASSTEHDLNIVGEREGTFWSFLDWIGILPVMKYWYFSYDHFYPEKVSCAVICSRDRHFPAYDAHEKIKRIMKISGRTSLHLEIHHHMRISKDQYVELLIEEGKVPKDE